VAIVSRRPPEESFFGLGTGDGGDFSSRLAYARFGDLHLVNTYVPQGQAMDRPAFAAKLAWLERRRLWFPCHFDPSRDAVAWVGDLNMAPEPADVHDHRRLWPHVCHCQPVTDAFRRMIAWGMVDVCRRFMPGPEVFTFWDYRQVSSFSGNRGWRVDHILATAPLADRALSARVDRAPRALERPSDHTVVEAVFSDPRPPGA